MTEPLDPDEIYALAEAEGRRRLDMPPLEQVATAFIAGVTVVFGIVALGVVHGLVEPRFGGEIADLAGSAAFGIALVLLVVGRTELFSENFFDPVAATLSNSSSPHRWARLVRLWSIVLMLNLVGGVVLVGVLIVDGALPDRATRRLPQSRATSPTSRSRRPRLGPCWRAPC
jgi:formate-nitrite transporter family protein